MPNLLETNMRSKYLFIDSVYFQCARVTCLLGNGNVGSHTPVPHEQPSSSRPTRPTTFSETHQRYNYTPPQPPPPPTTTTTSAGSTSTSVCI